MRALLVLFLCCALAAAEPRRAKGRSGGRKPNFKIVEDPSAVPQVSASEKDVSNREGKGMLIDYKEYGSMLEACLRYFKTSVNG